jgi:tetratricopeptide (TPR) repeat protein
MRSSEDFAKIIRVRLHTCRRLVFPILIGVSVLLLQSTLIHATLQEDSRGVLPPASTDHSPYVAGIRKALESQDLSSAQGAIHELIRLEPKNFEGFYWQGYLEVERHNYPDAVRFLRRAEALDNNAPVLKLLGLSYYFLEQFHLFTFVMQEAIEKDPSDFAPYYYLGRYYASTDVIDFDRAISYFQEALKRRPVDYESRYYLGYCDESRVKLDDAEQEYMRAMELAAASGARFALPIQGMARLRLHQAKPTEALQFAMQAVKSSPDDAAGHIVLARAYAELHQKDRAAFEWQRAVELSPTDPTPHYRLYRTYLELGYKEKADRAFAIYKSIVAVYGDH